MVGVCAVGRRGQANGGSVRGRRPEALQIPIGSVRWVEDRKTTVLARDVQSGPQRRPRPPAWEQRPFHLGDVNRGRAADRQVLDGRRTGEHVHERGRSRSVLWHHRADLPAASPIRLCGPGAGLWTPLRGRNGFDGVAQVEAACRGVRNLVKHRKNHNKCQQQQALRSRCLIESRPDPMLPGARVWACLDLDNPEA